MWISVVSGLVLPYWQDTANVLSFIQGGEGVSRQGERMTSTGELPRLLRSLREARDLSQADVSRLTGLDSGYVARCEQGTRAPASVEIVERFAVAMKCTHEETNALLVAGGFVPLELRRLSLTDPDLLLVARLLDATALSPEFHDVVRHVVRSLAPLLLSARVTPQVSTSSDGGSGSPEELGITSAAEATVIAPEATARLVKHRRRQPKVLDS
jgi:transcriptional regulator with XRE-family HTH domain